jgi:hypothetical protein
MEINPFNPSATMLMALIFTTKHDYKNAMKLVAEASVDFPQHYGLLVMRLRLEAKFGRIDRALKTSRALLSFWRRSESMFEDDAQTFHHHTTMHSVSDAPQRHAENGSSAQRLVSLDLRF